MKQQNKPTVNRELQASYDQVAQEYARQFSDEMSTKPFDRKMLDWLIEKVDGAGMLCDLGCGPGQIARYLHQRGAPACGVDLSAEMVKHAQALNPELHFQQGNMLALTDVTDQAFGGIAAFYSLIHIPRPDMLQALGEIKRVLRPRGVLLVTFHIGREVIHLDEWWGKKISADFFYYETKEMREYLKEAGFEQEEAIERDPYPDIEYQSRRAYIFVRKPG